MRKSLCLILCLVFALGVFVGYGPADAHARGGGGSGCFYTCDCAGNPLQCCPTPFGIICTPTEVIQCPQGYNC